jgi:hypothetical protein
MHLADESKITHFKNENTKATKLDIRNQSHRNSHVDAARICVDDAGGTRREQSSVCRNDIAKRSIKIHRTRDNVGQLDVGSIGDE